MSFTLAPLPYAYDALEPYIDAQTMTIHHDKHHQAYVDNVNKAITGTPNEGKTIEELVAVAGTISPAVRNNGGGHWNHTFFWHCMKPNGGGAPTGEAANRINDAFGSLEDFKAKFKNAGATQFGSGYAWLVLDKGELKVLKTNNAVDPLVSQQTPLLTCDVWEHSYYLDYQNRRPDFLQTFLDHLVNWEFVAQQL